jgi:carbonic anhydrase/acetyltransferase-like protein (isoleucine patch superfamily)
MLQVPGSKLLYSELESRLTEGTGFGMREIGEAFVASNAVITGDVRLAPGANVWFGCVIRGDLARVSFGTNANLQDGCIVHTDCDEPQAIEDGVVVGHAAILHGRRIGAHALVGMGARLLSGCEIGEGCIIAAGAIVTERKIIPPRSLVVGIPGKVVRQVTEEEIQRTRSIAAHYLDMAKRYARGEIPRIA